MPSGPSTQTNRAPDFFLIGVPRAGTTSLYHALQRHPQLYLPALKEACFTCPDVNPETRHRLETRFFSDRADYLALFTAARPDQLIGEGCTYNIYSSVAPGLIRALNPDARILVQLRDPIEQMYSNHGHKLIMGDLRQDFESELDRQAAARSRRGAARPSMHDYDMRDKATVSAGLARFLGEFGRAQVNVSLYEEFAARPLEVMRDTLRFLGVADGDPPLPKIEVPHRATRWDGLNRTMASARVIGRAKRLTPTALHPLARRVASTIFRSNRRRATRAPLAPALRARLRSEFRPEVERLSELVGRDLAAVWWSQGPAPGA